MSDETNQVAKIEKSKVVATVGRVLHAYSTLWRGPRPATVVNAWGAPGVANVSVTMDQANDHCLPAQMSMPSVDVFDALTEKEAQHAMELVGTRSTQVATYKVVCCWPPRG